MRLAREMGCHFAACHRALLGHHHTLLGCTPSACPLAPRKQPFSSGPGLNPGRADRCKKSVQMSELVVLGLVSPAGQHHTGPPAVTAYKCTNAAAVAAPLWLAALVLD